MKQALLDALLRLLPRPWSCLVITMTRYGESRLAYALRHAAYRSVLRKMGDNVVIFPAVFIYRPEYVSIGNNVSIHEFTYIHGYKDGNIDIGDSVLIAKGCGINASNHRFDIPGIPIRESGEDYKPIVIENNVWLGLHVCVLSGVTIHSSSVIGAGAVVTKDVPSNLVAVGVPAHPLRSILTMDCSPATSNG